MSPKLMLPSVALPCPGFSKSSGFIALDCPRFPSRLVTVLVTGIALTLTLGKCWLAIMQASVWYLAPVLSSRSRLRAEGVRPEERPRLISAGTPFQ